MSSFSEVLLRWLIPPFSLSGVIYSANRHCLVNLLYPILLRKCCMLQLVKQLQLWLTKKDHGNIDILSACALSSNKWALLSLSPFSNALHIQILIPKFDYSEQTWAPNNSHRQIGMTTCEIQMRIELGAYAELENILLWKEYRTAPKH